MALKIVYKICCGIDVHKTFVVACIASTDKHGVTSYERHRFSTYTKGLKNLLQWLLEHNCKDVCMESTGKYWIPVYNILEKDCSIVLAHPKYVKANTIPLSPVTGITFFYIYAAFSCCVSCLFLSGLQPNFPFPQSLRYSHFL